jgi:hypothetical protein
LSHISAAALLVLLMGISMIYAFAMASYDMIYLPSFVKIGTGVQAILRFCLSNLKGCNVGITDGVTYDIRR